MASRIDYEIESPYKADSPLSYDVEEGELSPGSGRSSPGTIRDNPRHRIAARKRMITLTTHRIE